MKKYFIVFLFFLSHTFLSQSNKIDSLLLVANNFKNDSNKVKTLYKIADVYRKNYKYDSALTYANKALFIAKKLPNKKFEALNYGLFGMIYTSQGNYSEALQNHKKSLELKLVLKDKQGIANSYNNIGDVNYQLGNYAEALVNHFASLKLKEELKDKQSIANSYNNIGSVYNAQANYQESLKYHFLSLKLREEINDKNGITMSYNNIAINYNSLKNYTEAIKYHQLALANNIEIKNKKGVAITYGNIGNSYYYLELYEQALNYYTQSLKIREEIADKKGIAVCHHNIANTNIKLKKYEDARVSLDKAIILNTQLNGLGELKDNFFTNSKLYYEEENFKEALNYYKKYIQYRDSIFNIDNDKKSARAQIQYEFEKQQAVNEAEFEKQKILAASEIEKRNFLIEKNQQSFLILQQQNKLNELSLNKSKLEVVKKDKENTTIQSTAKKDSESKQLIIQFTIGIVFLLFVILFIIIRSLLINRKKNAIIAGSLNEKEILLKEIHHRVKNNLQVISSLLNLQSRYIKDENALNAINESKERINAISLLHKEIYQNEVLKLIDAKNYFTNLAFNLQNTFDPKKNCELQLNIEELFLDIDTLIPLGLIVNELITNAYKYGSSQVNAIINFTVSVNNKIITLIINDNGKGFDSNFNSEATNSVGTKLISLFAKKIMADVVYSNNGGACITITFNLKNE